MAMEETETYYVTPISDNVAIDFDHVTAGWNINNLEVRKNYSFFNKKHLQD